MSWNCQCELCRDAYAGKFYDRRWIDFLHHRDDAILRANFYEHIPFYLTESDGEIIVTTEPMDGYKTATEVWKEEVLLIEFLRGCEVEPVEGHRTPFKHLLREGATSTV
jgi:hypothetical protein